MDFEANITLIFKKCENSDNLKTFTWILLKNIGGSFTKLRI